MQWRFVLPLSQNKRQDLPLVHEEQSGVTLALNHVHSAFAALPWTGPGLSIFLFFLKTHLSSAISMLKPSSHSRTTEYHTAYCKVPSTNRCFFLLWFQSLHVSDYEHISTVGLPALWRVVSVTKIVRIDVSVANDVRFMSSVAVNVTIKYNAASHVLYVQ